MDNTLIVFASDHGTVEKCARHLFRLLEGNVDICNLEQRDFFPDVSNYDAIIIGGSIHSGAVQECVSKFCEENLQILQTKRLGLFINCLYTGEKARKQLEAAYPAVLNEKAFVRDYFGGEVDKTHLTFWERVITSQMIKKNDLRVALSKDKIERFAQIMNGEEPQV